MTRQRVPDLLPGFTPPACTTPTLFADVPAASPFCRYIEEPAVGWPRAAAEATTARRRT